MIAIAVNDVQYFTLNSRLISDKEIATHKSKEYKLLPLFNGIYYCAINFFIYLVTKYGIDIDTVIVTQYRIVVETMVAIH